MKKRIASSMLAATTRRVAFFAALWVLLTGASVDGWLVGVLVVPACVWISLGLLPPVHPIRPVKLVILLPGFVWRSVIGGVDVARRVFDPRMPLDPGWVAVPVDLGPGGRTALGSELSLMPGTLVAGSSGDKLLIHLLDRKQDIAGAVQLETRHLRSLVRAPEAP